MKIAVVGAGIMGASTAFAASRRGHEIVVFDQFGVGHTKGSSHGNSRIVRKAYPDPFYTEIMLEGYELWRNIQSLASEQILFETGLAYFGKTSSEEMHHIVFALVQNGVEQDSLEASHIPHFTLHDDEWGTFTPDAGWVFASRAVREQLRLSGARVVESRIDNPRALIGEFDRVIVCAGAWTKGLYGLPVTVTQQTFAYIKTETPRPGPVWIDDTYPMLYGFPSEPGRSSIKIGVHSEGIETDPDVPGEPEPRYLEMIQQYARERFTVLDPVVEEATTCLYTRTADEDFLWSEDGPGVFWVSPCSGHGFKFGPWIGERMVDFAEGKMRPSDVPRFNLS